jgi:hypothetical protein
MRVVCTVLALSACADSTPAAIQLTAPDGPIFTAEVQYLAPRVVNAAGETLAAHHVNFLSSVADVASVTPDGHFLCQKAGTTTITATSGPITASTQIICSLVAKIEAPKELKITMGKSIAVPVKALDSSGGEVPGITPFLSSADPNVASTKDFEVTPVSPGSTNVMVKAGAATTTIVVNVQPPEAPAKRLKPMRREAQDSLRWCYLWIEEGAPLGWDCAASIGTMDPTMVVNIENETVILQNTNVHEFGPYQGKLADRTPVSAWLTDVGDGTKKYDCGSLKLSLSVSDKMTYYSVGVPCLD